MRVLFFDIDGVLNDHNFDEVAKSNTLVRSCVGQFNRVIFETGCKLVISSAWRYMVFGGAITLKGFEYLLRTHGCTEAVNIVGTTVSDEEIADRSDQIRNYVASHPEITSWVAVDDLLLDLPKGNYVKTDGDVGLTFDKASEAIRKLNGSGSDK